MFKILIADDEPKIQRGLRNMIDDMRMDAEIVGMAEDGEQALQMAGVLSPDILLVDINMPFMNGLQLIEALNAVSPDIKTLVVTGFEEFEYARRALSMNVSAYLLKPVERDELRAALLSAMEALSRERETRRHLDFATKQLEKRKDVLREVFLRDILADQLSEAEIEEQLAYFGLDAAARYALVVVIRGEEAGGMSALMFRYALEGVLSTAALAEDAILFMNERDHVLILCRADAPEAVAEAVRGAVQAQLCIAVETLFGDVPHICTLADAYESLLERRASGLHHSPAVEAARAFIAREHGRPELSLSDAAAYAGVAPAYLSRLMKRELGLSFSRYLSITRIRRATALMEDSYKTLKAISEEVGYASPFYFSTAFKKLLGMSPNEYRSERKDK